MYVLQIPSFHIANQLAFLILCCGIIGICCYFDTWDHRQPWHPILHPFMIYLDSLRWKERDGEKGREGMRALGATILWRFITEAWFMPQKHERSISEILVHWETEHWIMHTFQNYTGRYVFSCFATLQFFSDSIINWFQHQLPHLDRNSGRAGTICVDLRLNETMWWGFDVKMLQSPLYWR